jgi:hypothetical protein
MSRGNPHAFVSARRRLRRMNAYIVVFEWPAAAKIPARTERLNADSPEDAKTQAALMYGATPFEQGLPSRYLIFDGGGALIFRFPTSS